MWIHVCVCVNGSVLMNIFLNQLLTFCLNRFGWSSRRTEETLQPVMKQLNNQQVTEIFYSINGWEAEIAISLHFE